MRRLSLLALVLLAAAIASGCGQFGKRYTGSEDAKSSALTEKQITSEPFDEAAAKEAGCDGTKATEYESEGRNHTTDPDEKVTYKTNPPTSGDHYQIASEWGLYDETQPDVETTHNLEHGHIVITYKGLSKKDRDALYEQARINDFHLLVEPREKNPKDGVYYSAWTAQLYCKHPSKAALQYMIDTWRDQGPELFTDDSGGGAMGGGSKDS